MNKVLFERELHKALARVSELPDYMQEIMLQDINAAIVNRIAIMEMIARKIAGKPA